MDRWTCSTQASPVLPWPPLRRHYPRFSGPRIRNVANYLRQKMVEEPGNPRVRPKHGNPGALRRAPIAGDALPGVWLALLASGRWIRARARVVATTVRGVLAQTTARAAQVRAIRRALGAPIPRSAGRAGSLERPGTRILREAGAGRSMAGLAGLAGSAGGTGGASLLREPSWPDGLVRAVREPSRGP